MSLDVKFNQALPKITVLYDNRGSNPALKHGFGFSCLIEWKDRKILFDTGGDKEAFFSNGRQLGIDLTKITDLVFSHKHWDHTAGIKEVFGSVPKTASVYVPSAFPHSLRKDIPSQLNVKTVGAVTQVCENIYSFTLTGGWWCTRIKEQSLVLKTVKGLVILTGCAHPGILKIIKTAKGIFGDEELPVHLVMGGFHLHHSFSCTIDRTVRQMEKLGVEKVAPCHCAGDRAIKKFQEVFDRDFIAIETGTVSQI